MNIILKETKMAFKKGDRLKHPTLENWGIGEMLEDEAGGKIKVFFTGVGEKSLSLEYVKPILVMGAEAESKQLDHLRIPQAARYKSLAKSIEGFLDSFPEGFSDPKYLLQERNYKIKGHDLAVKLLGKESLTQLINEKAYSEICQRALKVVNATNLIFPNEKMALKDGLKTSETQEKFATSLYQLLFGSNDFDVAFKDFCKVLEQMDAAKWTTVSYFLFLMFPDRHMFVKPTVTQNAADICAFDINYRPELNWTTYQLILEFADVLRVGIVDLHPRDMIDVQSFMWCISA